MGWGGGGELVPLTSQSPIALTLSENYDTITEWVVNKLAHLESFLIYATVYALMLLS